MSMIIFDVIGGSFFAASCFYAPKLDMPGLVRMLDFSQWDSLIWTGLLRRYQWARLRHLYPRSYPQPDCGVQGQTQRRGASGDRDEAPLGHPFRGHHVEPLPYGREEHVRRRCSALGTTAAVLALLDFLVVLHVAGHPADARQAARQECLLL